VLLWYLWCVKYVICGRCVGICCNSDKIIWLHLIFIYLNCNTYIGWCICSDICSLYYNTYIINVFAVIFACLNYNTYIRWCICSDIRLSVLQHIHWTMAEKHSQLPSVDCSTLLQFAKDIFKSVYVEGLVQGNISVEVCVVSVQCSNNIIWNFVTVACFLNSNTTFWNTLFLSIIEKWYVNFITYVKLWNQSSELLTAAQTSLKVMVSFRLKRERNFF